MRLCTQHMDDVCTCALSKECCSGGRALSHLTRGEHSESSASIACMCTVLRTLLRRDGHVPLLPEVHVLSSDSGRVCREPLNSARMGYGHQRRFQTPLACHPLRLITWCGPHQPNPPINPAATSSSSTDGIQSHRHPCMTTTGFRLSPRA